MKYFIDTEFREEPGTIDLISIGIVSEGHVDCNYERPNGKGGCEYPQREYYAISKEFDIKAAWNSWQPKTEMRDSGMRKVEVKEYWLRENVLKPIFDELVQKENAAAIKQNRIIGYGGKINTYKFNLKFFKRLVNKYGKPNVQIAEEIQYFVYSGCECSGNIIDWGREIKPEFYAYYADYDWVVFCWIFGKMIDLPEGFPMYCRDLKQTSDELYEKHKKIYFEDSGNKANKSACFLNKMSDHLDYPKQSNEHNALADAKWNKRLYEFLMDI